MLAYAAREFALMRSVGDDGLTERDHQRSHFRQTGRWANGWEPVECPPSCLYLWQHWLSMSRRRPRNGMGVCPITDDGVEAYQRRRGIVLHPVENMVIDEIEDLFLFTQAKAAGKK